LIKELIKEFYGSKRQKAVENVKIRTSNSSKTYVQKTRSGKIFTDTSGNRCFVAGLFSPKSRFVGA
jgi:hypothetical protein